MTGGLAPRTISSRGRHAWKSRASYVAPSGASTAGSRLGWGRPGNRTILHWRRMWWWWRPTCQGGAAMNQTKRLHREAMRLVDEANRGRNGNVPRGPRMASPGLRPRTPSRRLRCRRSYSGTNSGRPAPECCIAGFTVWRSARGGTAIATALSSEPPDEIAEELRTCWNRCTSAAKRDVGALTGASEP